MKKLTIALAALSLLIAFSACRRTIDVPSTPTDGESEAQTTQLPEEETTAAETTTGTETPTGTETTTAIVSDPTRPPISDPASLPEQIPLSNAYFSLVLPGEWYEKYVSQTSFDDHNIMTVRLLERASAEAGADGTLFTLALIPEEAGDVYPGAKELKTLITSAGRYSLSVIYPEKPQFAPQEKEQYNKMLAQAEDIFATLEPGYGWTFE